MSKQQLEECSECGAMTAVERMSKHRRWHDVLSEVVPRLPDQLAKPVQAGPPPNLWIDGSNGS